MPTPFPYNIYGICTIPKVHRSGAPDPQITQCKVPGNNRVSCMVWTPPAQTSTTSNASPTDRVSDITHSTKQCRNLTMDLIKVQKKLKQTQLGLRKWL